MCDRRCGDDTGGGSERSRAPHDCRARGKGVGLMIEVEGIRARFGDHVVFDGLTFAVAKGDVLGLAGPIGAGKTTLLRILATVLRADGGTARVAGVDVAAHPVAARRRLGYLPQTSGFYERMTLLEDLEFHAGVHGVVRGRRRSLASELLEVMDLADRRNEDVSRLDGDSLRRLALARTLVHDPEVLLLDEPATGMLPSAKDLEVLIGELAAMGKTVLVTGRRPGDLESLGATVRILAARGLLPEEARQREEPDAAEAGIPAGGGSS
jgi:ABC-2 type transport system ATP-binding protein